MARATAPVANGLDIANYGTVTGTDKWFYEASTVAAAKAKGQTFKTGSTTALLKSVSYQVTSSQMAAPTKGYTIRVGTVTGTTFAQIASETATQSVTPCRKRPVSMASKEWANTHIRLPAMKIAKPI